MKIKLESFMVAHSKKRDLPLETIRNKNVNSGAANVKLY